MTRPLSAIPVRRLIPALLALLAAFAAPAQHLTWEIDFGSVFDNREGSNRYTDTKTFFFTHLAPEIGLRLSDKDRIAGGVVWDQPIGCQWEGARVSPTLYYRRVDGRWRFSMGMFPRRQLREQMPEFLWSDSLSYHQNNIRGVLVQYEHPGRGFFDAYVDWRGMQTATQREAFNIVFHGLWRPRREGLFFIGAHAMMNHFALSRENKENQHIVDNFLANPYVGANLARVTPLDSLRVRAGLLLTVERNRANPSDSWQTPCGGWLELTAQYRRFGLKNSLYAGGKLFPSYLDFGASLYQGEPFYRSSLYNRTDVWADIIRGSVVGLRASLNFHVTSDAFIFYQRLILRVNIGSRNLPRRPLVL
ncbi:MAG: hypothetical protein NC210_10075 [[Clostridium] fimetarium]|nr:hypothetical protein [Alistipes timonensis]MCM1406758.1 hypothetical protein [[Clostridium] fimetarium]